MIIKCTECGANISDRAKFCPQCGCPNKSKTKLSIACLVLGIIALIYGVGSCVNNFFTEHTQSTILPAIIIMGGLSIIFGCVSICKTKSLKKSLVGMILGTIAIIVAIIGKLLL